MWTSRQFIDHALSELGMAAHTYDIQPELLTESHEAMKMMIAGWEPMGVSIGYNMAAGLEEDSGIADETAEVVYTMLACRLAPRLGKTVAAETKTATIMGFNALRTRSIRNTSEQQMPGTMPRGAGNRGRSTFYPQPDLSPVTVTTGGNLRVS